MNKLTQTTTLNILKKLERKTGRLIAINTFFEKIKSMNYKQDKFLILTLLNKLSSNNKIRFIRKNIQILTEKEKILDEYENLPVNSKKFDRVSKRYFMAKGVEKKNGKQYFCITIMKKVNKNNFKDIKTIFVEEF